MEKAPREAGSLLVVGAGLPGAVLAWLGSASGFRVTLVSSTRPASGATALHPGLVFGPGPPVGPSRWLSLPGDLLAACGRRARRGRALLHRFLLENDDPVGIRRCPSEVPLGREGSLDALQVASCLRAAGFPVETGHDEDGAPVIRRPRDAVLLPRRAVFSLLRGAREHGAEIRLGVPLEGWEPAEGGGVIARLGGEERWFERIAWTSDRPPPAPADPGRFGVSIVLRQELAAGTTRLDRVLVDPRGTAVLAPHPGDGDRVVLVRRGRLDPGGEMEWPSHHPRFLPYLGQAIRQRLAEVTEGPLQPGVPPEETMAVLSGLAGWPVAQVLGACAEILEAWGGRVLPGGSAAESGEG